jgi:elongation factor 1-gamma
VPVDLFCCFFAQTLYTYPENFRAYKAQIAARYSGAQVKVVQDAPAFKFGETNKSAEFLKKFPTGKVRQRIILYFG